jgi:cobalt/nickel transport system permease protein
MLRLIFCYCRIILPRIEILMCTETRIYVKIVDTIISILMNNQIYPPRGDMKIGGIDFMHMADALVAPAVATTMYVASGAAAIYSVNKVRLEQDTKKVAVMGVMGAFVFAAQMINFTIPGTGSSGHITGGLMLSALLGPYAGFLTMIAVLLVQCLMFGDGGLLALGCNIWNMAFYACFFGYFCIYRPILRGKYSKVRSFAASMIGCILSLQLGAFSVTLETLASGITELPFSAFLLSMQPIHLAIGAVEGLITAAVLIFISETRGELIHETVKRNRFSLKKVVVILAIITVFIGGGLSLAASSNPDGLEWSIGKVSESGEVESEGKAYTTSEKITNKTAVLPDYALKNSDSAAGTSLSGIIGAAVVGAVCVIAGICFKIFRKRSRTQE